MWIFVLACLLSSARLVIHTTAITHDGDTAQRAGHRFDAIRKVLPKRGIIGYFGPSGDSVGHYYLAQYALAPIVVDHSANHAIVIGDFPNSQPVLLPGNLRVLEDFGDGLFLLANKDAH